MRHPKFAKNEAAQRLVRVLAPLVTVSGIESESQHLDVALHSLQRCRFEIATAAG